MADINWSLLGPALSIDYAGRVQQGFQAGQEQRDKSDLRNALASYSATSNPRALLYIKSVNPTLGASLEDRSRDDQAREATGTVLGTDFAPVNALAPPSTDATPVAGVMPGTTAAASSSPTADAWRTLAKTSPDTFIALRRLKGEERKQVADTLTAHLELGGRVMGAVLSVPAEQQDAVYQQVRHELAGAGVTDLPDSWDPVAAQARMRMGMTVAQALGADVASAKADAYVGNINADNRRADRNTDSLIQTRQERAQQMGRPKPQPQPQQRLPTPTTVVGRIMDKQSRGEQLTPAEQQTMTEYRATSRRRPSASAPVQVHSIEEARRLAPGTVFITPDGRQKVR